MNIEFPCLYLKHEVQLVNHLSDTKKPGDIIINFCVKKIVMKGTLHTKG